MKKLDEASHTLTVMQHWVFPWSPEQSTQAFYALRDLMGIYEDEHEVRQTLTTAVANLGTHYAANKRAHREIRARLAAEDVPIHVSADIEQILCETAGDFGEEKTDDRS